MNEDNFELADKYVSHSYVQQGKEARRVLEKNIRQLLEQGKIPTKGWNDVWIKHLLQVRTYELRFMNLWGGMAVWYNLPGVWCFLVREENF